MTRLDQIRERLSKVTPGEWPPVLGTEEDIELVRHSKADIQHLLDEVGRLREALEFYADPDNLITGFNSASGSRYVKREYHDVAINALSGKGE